MSIAGTDSFSCCAPTVITSYSIHYTKLYEGLIEFGDREGAIRLMEEVGKGTPLGRVLGSGAEITGSYNFV